jgi:hypothetical protein
MAIVLIAAEPLGDGYASARTHGHPPTSHSAWRHAAAVVDIDAQLHDNVFLTAGAYA